MRIEDIERLADLVASARITELSLEARGRSVTLRKSAHYAPEPAAPAPVREPAPSSAPATPETPAPRQIIAPMVGVFHPVGALLAPDAEIEPGQIVGAIESMKLMNDVRAEEGGVIAEVLIEEGMPVEYGQPLFTLES